MTILHIGGSQRGAKLSMLGLGLASVLSVRCASSDEPGSAGPSAGGSSGSGPDAAGGTAGTSGAAGASLIDAGTSCPSNVLCGDSGSCCPAGTECVEGACAAACASGVRCGAMGATCCNTGEVCSGEQCTAPGAPCNDSYDCAENEFCEPTLGRCLPQPTASSLCEFRPAPLPFQPLVEWSWTQSSIAPAKLQVINVPIVVELDGDGVPEVVIVSSESYDHDQPGLLRALDGRTGSEKWAASADVSLPANAVNPRGTPAAADIDGDHLVDIVVPKMGGGLIAFNADGSLKWRSTRADGVTAWNEVLNSATVAIAHMDADSQPEILVGGTVLDNQGRVRSGEGRGLAGGVATTYGTSSVIADVDADGAQDVVTGAFAWRVDGSQIWSNGEPDGYTAVADFNADQQPEVVVVSGGQVRVQNATSGAVLARVTMPGTGRGGPPTIADFDADGQLEIASANGTAYGVFEYSATPIPKLSVKWQSPTQDDSSNVTGSSVFDFEGDGAAEVVYGDECFFRVYSGRDGSILYETPSTSATIHEYPVVADVDGDNNTEVVVVSNDLHHADPLAKCPAYKTGTKARRGVFVYGDSHDKWVRTRKVWNQHAYHITNINADGTLPNPEPRSWLPPQGFNNYRVSTQGTGIYNAPDISVDLEVSSVSCPTELTLRARVKNSGSLGVAAGVTVSFYQGTSAAGSLLGEAKTTRALLPGESEVVSIAFPLANALPPFSFFVSADGGSASAGVVNECREDNNSASAGGVVCPAPVG